MRQCVFRFVKVATAHDESIIGRLRRPVGSIFVFPAPRAWMQILPYGQFASVARGGAIITSPFHGSVGIYTCGLGEFASVGL